MVKSIFFISRKGTIKIYSKNAILGFSMFFAPIFGGFLLRQNLIDNDQKKEGNIVLFISILFSALTIIIVNSLETRNSSATYFLNMSWGLVLSEYFFKKHFSDGDYEYKKIWKALIVSIAITIPFVLAMIYAKA